MLRYARKSDYGTDADTCVEGILQRMRKHALFFCL